MKKTRSILLLASFVSLTTITFAQSPEVSKGKIQTTFGVKVGPNLSNLYVDDVTDENAKFGFEAGLFAKAPITSFFSIQPELIYSQKGAQVEYNNLFAKGKAKFNLHYVELPVMAVFNLGNNFNIHAGPYIAYLAGVNVKNNGDNTTLYDFNKEINKDNFQQFDYGVAGGIGFDGQKIGLGIRYNYGLKEIGKERQVFGQTYTLNNAKNSVAQIYLTIGL